MQTEWEIHKRVGFEILKGETLSSVEVSKDFYKDDHITFTTVEGCVFIMHHEQACCESVSIEEIYGDLDDLIDSPIELAEEVSNSSNTEYGSCTWTFYKLATAKGYVTIRWYGESNGYYSESVNLDLDVRTLPEDLKKDFLKA